MADPRNTLAYTDIKPDGASDVGYEIDNDTIVYDSTKARGAAATMLDKAVTLSDDNTIALTADGDAVLGKLMSVESDGKARVQELGHMTLPKGDGSVTRMTKVVGNTRSGAKGYIRSAASGTAAELLKGRGFIHDVSDNDEIGVALY